MVIAIVGRSFSGKRRLARYIENHSKKGFRIFKQFTTKPDYNKSRHMYISEADRKTIPDSRVFYSSLGDSGYEYFSLISQFRNGGDLIYVMDNPKAIERLDILDVPYAVVYVDCNMSDTVKRSSPRRVKLLELLSRFFSVRGSLHRMKCDGHYSMYINTSVLDLPEQSKAMGEFYRRISDWRQVRGNDEMHPQELCLYQSNWLRKAEKDGYMIASFDRGE